MLVNTKDFKKVLNILNQVVQPYINFEIVDNNTLVLYAQCFYRHLYNPFVFAKFTVNCYEITKQDMVYKKFSCRLNELVNFVNNLKVKK